MPASIKAIAQSTVRGKNAVVTAVPGMGVTSKVIAALENEGLSIGYLDMAHCAGIHLGQQTLEGNELRLKVTDDFLLAETLVLNNGSYITSKTLEVVASLMSDRILYGTRLPKVKSVIVLFTEDPHGTAPKLSKMPNTIKVDVR